MGRDTLMPFTFVYTDRTKRVKKFNSPREAAEFAHNEGDHLVAWSAGDWKDRIDVV